MAEFAASIIGIVSAGTKVTLVLSQLAADVGSAGKEARMIGNEIRSFCAVIKTLGETLEKVQSSQYYAHCTELIQDMTNASIEMFTEILDASENLRSMTKAKDGKEAKFGLVERVQWAVFKKPKIMVLRAAIEAYKSNLALMLGTLNAAEKVTRRMSTKLSLTAKLNVEEETDRSLLQSLELEHRASLIDLAQSEQQYQEGTIDADAHLGEQEAADSPTETQSTSEDALPPPLIPWMDSLVGSVREEIESIRSSLSRSLVFDAHELQGRVSRHSERLSLLMVEDQKRISQRWSADLDSEALDASVAISSEAFATNPGAHSPPLGKRTWVFSPEAADDPFYHEVLKWLMRQTPSERRTMLNKLVRDIGEMPPTPPGSATASSLVHSTPPPSAKVTAFAQEYQQQEAQAIADAQRFMFNGPIQVAVLDPDKIALQKDMLDRVWAQRLTELEERLRTERETRSRGRGGVRKRLGQENTNQPGMPSVTEERDQAMIRRIKQEISAHSNTVNEKPLSLVLRDEEISYLSEEVIDIIVRSSVADLGLSRNNLTNLPASFVFCSQLRYLSLKGNEFEFVPDPVLHLPALEMLDMSSNRLRALPLDISRMESLQVLSVENNSIQGLPLSIGDMSKLRILKYQENPLVFPAPQALEAFIPERYAPSTNNIMQRYAQYTKRLKVFLKMTFPLSPGDDLAIKGLLPPPSQSPIDVLLDQRLNRSGPNIGFLKPSTSDTSTPEVANRHFPFAPPQLARANPSHYRELSSDYAIPGHRKARSHDITIRGKDSQLAMERMAIRRRSFNSSAPPEPQVSRTDLR